jgi:Trk K+ transport system NAD-binding subunit
VAQIPGPDLVVQEGDVVYIAVSADALGDLDALMAAPRARAH